MFCWKKEKWLENVLEKCKIAGHFIGKEKKSGIESTAEGEQTSQ